MAIRPPVLALAAAAVLLSGAAAQAQGVGGTLLRESGYGPQPVRHTEVVLCRVDRPDRCTSTFTGSDGSFYLPASPGGHDLRVVLPDRSSFGTRIEVTDGLGPLEIVLPR